MFQLIKRARFQQLMTISEIKQTKNRNKLRLKTFNC